MKSSKLSRWLFNYEELKEGDLYEPTRAEFFRDLSVGVIILWGIFHLWNWWVLHW